MNTTTIAFYWHPLFNCYIREMVQPNGNHIGEMYDKDMDYITVCLIRD